MAEDALAEAEDEANQAGRNITGVRLDRDAIEQRAGAVDDLLKKSLSEVAGRKATEFAGPGISGVMVRDRVEEHLEALSDTYLRDQLGGALTAAQNQGRATVFEAAKPKRLAASEVLDKATCSECLNIDGKFFYSVAEASAAYPSGGYYACRGGPRCRGMIIPIYE